MKVEPSSSPHPSPYSASPRLGRSQPPRPATLRGQELTAKLLLSGALDSQVTDSQYIRSITVSDDSESEDWDQSISQPIEDMEVSLFSTAIAEDRTHPNATSAPVKDEEAQAVAASITCSLSVAEWDLIKAIRAHTESCTTSVRDQAEHIGKEYNQLRNDYKKLTEEYELGKVRNEKLEQMVGDVLVMLNTC
ncbi:hypothetical protein BDN71DRAFT_1507667 [Pleurotus eryngii]|uniref:Uncharacterized protein n=1 Tax=Pleurotus eryngii TaxID=5323 RepID=A0A9P5ZXA6_PLEER|nr:hypothetical protein BDN71DRAFT_1507667 [Pleurotus eryngii]